MALATKEVNKLKLQLQILSLECSMFDYNSVNYIEICRKVDLVVNEGDKESLTFFKTLDKLMIEVKELTVATEDQNLKRIAEIAAREEAEKQRLQAEEEARIIAEIKAKEFEAERRRLQAEEEARRIAEIEAKKAERKRLQAEEEARRISEIKAKEIERRRLQAEEGARCVAELLAKEDFERKRVQAEYEAMKFPKIQGEEIEKQRIQSELWKARMTSAEKWMINFPKPDVSLHVPGFKSAAFICNIVDAKNGIFHILGIQEKKILPKMSLRKLIPLDKEPQIGSIFVQKTSSNLLVRVVRIPAVADEIVGDRNMKVIILETGEFTYIDFSKPGSYEIPENLRYVPSYAHLCKLVEYTNPNQTVEDFVKVTLHKRLDYKVIGVEKGGPISKLYDVLIIKYLPTLLPSLILVDEAQDEVEKNCWANTLFPKKSEDKIGSVTSGPVKIKFPEVGAILWIEPIQVVSINKFYGHYIPDSDMLVSHDFQTIRLSPLSQLTMDMNSEEALENMKPCIDKKKGDLVLSYHDGFFYRAKIITLEIGYCNVFLVDYGIEHRVMNSDIRQCEEKFFVLPFQAIRIKIGNVQYDENKDKRQYELGIKLLQQSFRSKPLPAILQNVIADGEWIEVRVFDKNGDDIGEILVNEGYAKPKF